MNLRSYGTTIVSIRSSAINIFYLDSDPVLCAQYHNNSHTCKMILEYSQLLSTAHHVLDTHPVIECYKPTHINHPSAVWVRQSNNNYNWLHCLLTELCKEYTYRYFKHHKVERDGLLKRLQQTPVNIPVGYKTQPTQAMPDAYKCDDSIEAYRNYYKAGKSHLAKWSRRQQPEWF